MVVFADTPYTDPDPMLALIAEYGRDSYPDKVNLGPGAYRDDNGNEWILPAVQLAEKHLAANPPGHEYLPLAGLPAYRKAAAEVIFGPSSRLLKEGRVVTTQTISGSGAVHMAAAYLAKFYPSATVYNSRPSWSNHRVMFEHVGFKVADYPYWDPKTRGVDFDGMLETLKGCADGSIWILHACAHNPTGCDLTREQWYQVAELIKAKHLVPVLDSAYQGFASGDLDNDAWAIRYLLDELSLPGIVCQSFSKNMGLYGERIGALHMVLHDVPDLARVKLALETQLGWILRKEISSCGRYGAVLVTTLVTDPTMAQQWREDMKTMSGRIAGMRKALVAGLTARKTPGDWSFIERQIGMFSFTGLTPGQVAWMKSDKHIYMAETGRLSICGLTPGNMDYVCDAIDEAVRKY